ncbi:hypothetical protein P171DRAFT_474502 [Karstenula rhodostoma CBS 690.94]|uniref:Heterokaryon incompatibility domain-containing protein n=1 Tax=Karstenula rhodostoma CBS 690.94 TaxID=1392251 RepID=A0A9P4UA82_9PLEO|nr:hypothetical protein P171DRAFT_474502 [Karstenula rhodostoma CBS 690.94]
MNTVVYDDSPLRSNEIRLVKVLPGEWTDPIHCELQRTSLSDHPKYYTLSYVWGSPRARREIFLNGRPFAVTVNLQSALRHLRLRHQDGLVIWIDALSINQAHLDERTHQVDLMGRIYQSSKTVFIYLGDGLGEKRGNEEPPEIVHFHGDQRDMLRINEHLDQPAIRVHNTGRVLLHARIGYALLALAKTNAGGPHLVPDYTLSDREVYTQATVRIMQESKSLAVLSTDTGRKFRQDLPSWVPDWSAPGAQSNDIRTDAIRLYTVQGLKRASDVYSGEITTASVLQVSASSTAVVSHVEEVMWGDSADVSRNTISKWWAALENNASAGKTRFWELLCAEIFCEKAPSSANIGVRRTTPKDEITFVSWAIKSPRSPFNLQLYPTEAEQESSPGSAYYDRLGDAHLDKIGSQAARLWKSLLYLNLSTPNTGSLLEGLLWRGAADDGGFGANTSDTIHDRLAPFTGDRKVILEKLAEEHGLFWGDSMVANGRVREDVPWVDVFWEMEDKLRTRFGEELSLNTVDKTRQERIAAMDASIMAATLSRRLFFTRNGDVGLAPASTRPGDQVFYVAGGATPLVLRGCTDGGLTQHYEVVGDCYVLGMNDEAPPVIRYDWIHLV